MDDLFAELLPYQPNILPYDGEAIDYGVVLDDAMASNYYQQLLTETPWQHDEAKLYGKHYVTKRKVAWYGEDSFAYTYSGTTKYAFAWTDTLLVLKQLVEELSSHTFNSCLLNLYHDGQEGMAWHSDDEKSLGKNTAIASLSLGSARRFCFRHRQTMLQREILLQHGQLLVMQGATQQNWQHKIPTTVTIREPRINLTFRQIC